MWASVCRLAWADLWFDRRISFCIVASLVAVIAPLLLLFGLKHGVVSQMQQQLLQDPQNLEVKMISSGSHDPFWLEQLQQRPEVGYAVGMTRSLNTQADIRLDRRHFVDNIEIIATSQGDPLLGELARDLQPGQVLLSASAAQRLNWQEGQTPELRVRRRLHEQAETASYPVQVVGVVPAHRYARAALFVHPQVLLQVEYVRDGFQMPDWGLSTGAPLPDNKTVQYARARVYANSIDTVGPLAQWLASQHIETSSRLAEIENVKTINQVLSLIFGVIALTASVGCLASLVGAFMANVDRKRKDIAVLRLLGIPAKGIGLYVLVQAFLLTALAYLLGVAVYGLGSYLFNQVLATQNLPGDFSCSITLLHAFYAWLLVLGLAGGVALVSVWRAVQIEAAESLREL